MSDTQTKAEKHVTRRYPHDALIAAFNAGQALAQFTAEHGAMFDIGESHTCWLDKNDEFKSADSESLRDCYMVGIESVEGLEDGD